VPRLAALKDTLPEASPAQVMLALQTDARLAPAPGAVPVMHLTIRPRVAGAFEVVDKRLPMHISAIHAQSDPSLKGLRAAPAGRQWLIYRFTPESQDELAKVLRYFKHLQAQGDTGGGSLAMGIAHEGVAANHPALAHTRWESWLQTSAREGFYQLWSGTLGELPKRAAANPG
jgi:hypothetical protein